MPYSIYLSVVPIQKYNHAATFCQDKSYHFYPSQEALKAAYALGEVGTLLGITDTKLLSTSLNSFNNTTVAKTINYDRLVTTYSIIKVPNFHRS